MWQLWQGITGSQKGFLNQKAEQLRIMLLLFSDGAMTQAVSDKVYYYYSFDGMVDLYCILIMRDKMAGME
jgi:hypothetical protein